MWKRYNLRPNEQGEGTESKTANGTSNVKEEEFADTDRPIKRQCVTNGHVIEGKQQPAGRAQYFATLRATGDGTPKSQ